jgi:hypothetical protein
MSLEQLPKELWTIILFWRKKFIKREWRKKWIKVEVSCAHIPRVFNKPFNISLECRPSFKPCDMPFKILDHLDLTEIQKEKCKSRKGFEWCVSGFYYHFVMIVECMYKEIRTFIPHYKMCGRTLRDISIYALDGRSPELEMRCYFEMRCYLDILF